MKGIQDIYNLFFSGTAEHAKPSGPAPTPASDPDEWPALDDEWPPLTPEDWETPEN